MAAEAAIPAIKLECAMPEEKEPDYSFAWKLLLGILVLVILSGYIESHPALKDALRRHY
jgi:hypothetical protein